MKRPRRIARDYIASGAAQRADKSVGILLIISFQSPSEWRQFRPTSAITTRRTDFLFKDSDGGSAEARAAGPDAGRAVRRLSSAAWCPADKRGKKPRHSQRDRDGDRGPPRELLLVKPIISAKPRRRAEIEAADRAELRYEIGPDERAAERRHTAPARAQRQSHQQRQA